MGRTAVPERSAELEGLRNVVSGHPENPQMEVTMAVLPSPLWPGRGGVRFTVAGPASDGQLIFVERGVIAL